MAEPPAIVLVHGAWGRPQMWDQVIERLPSGHDVIVADLPTCSRPGTSLADDASHLQEIAGDGPVVLVGHSYGGAVITEAGSRVPGAQHLVYLAAAMPDAGESMFEWVTKRPTGREMPLEFSDDGMSMVIVDENDSPYDPGTTARLMQIGLRSFAIAGVTTPLTNAAWTTLPSTYLVATEDTTIHPDTQRQMAARADTTVEIDTEHQVIISRPDDVAELITRVVSEQ